MGREPTYFTEKILAGAGYTPIDPTRIPPMQGIIGLVNKPKIHTMREDPFDRWKAGKSIQMAYGVRTKNYRQFNKDIPELEKCVSTQRVKLNWIYKNKYVETKLPLRHIDGPHGGFDYYPAIWIDDKQMSDQQIEMLGGNDGFDSTVDFFKWFKKDFTGKLIHWSDFRY